MAGQQLTLGVGWSPDLAEWFPTGRYEALAGVLNCLEQRQGLSIEFFHPSWSFTGDSSPPREVYRLPFASRTDRRWDVLYSPHCDPSDLSLLYLRDALDTRLPVVFSMHGLPLFIEEFCGGALLTKRFRPYDAIVVTSKRAKRAFEELLTNEGLSAPQVELIPWGIDPRLFEAPPSKAEARRKLGIDPERVVCLSLGRLSPRMKGDIFPLLEAIAERRHELRRAKFTLYLAGYFLEDWYAKLVRQLITAREIEDLVAFLGTIEREDRPHVYGAADFAVNLSDCVTENQHLVAFECAASGLPQIVSDWDGLADAVDHGSNGYLVDTCWAGVSSDLIPLIQSWDTPTQCHVLGQSVAVDVESLGSYLIELTEDAGLRERMAANARERAEEHRWTVVGKQYEDLFRRLAGEAADAEVEPRSQPLEHLKWQTRGRFDPEKVAILRPAGRELIDGVRRLVTVDYLDHAYPEEVINEVMQLFDSKGEASLRYVQQYFGVANADHVTRVYLFLLKHGYIGWRR